MINLEGIQSELQRYLSPSEKGFRANSKCYRPIEKEAFHDDWVFLESRDGKDVAGNILRIAQELSTGSYGNLKLFLHVIPSTLERAKLLAKTYKLKNVRFITDNLESQKVMEQAKFLVSDSGLPWRYVKREGQVFLNTWHGTPLKHMGKLSLNERHAIGTVQHLFLSADYFLSPNQYLQETMLRDYMVENVMPGKVLFEGYPRNSVFFDTERARELRAQFEWDDKQLYAYLPTWRGEIKNTNKSELIEESLHLLSDLDAQLQNNQIMLFKPHPLMAEELDYAQFEHIIAFPAEYETYDILNTVDVLVTDYSSVFFDFANTRKKIILFPYDRELYKEERGLYLELEDFPFPIVETVQELVEELDKPKTYDDTYFISTYCSFDRSDACERLCKHVFLGEKCCEEFKPGNGKKNALIFAGALTKNGITSSLLGLLPHLQKDPNYNFFVCYRRWDIDSDLTKMDLLSEDVSYLPLMSRKFFTKEEQRLLERFSSRPQVEDADNELPEKVVRAYKREWRRCYGDVKFDRIYNFDGYGDDEILLFALAPCDEKAIWVHNDMTYEIHLKGNQRPAVLQFAYNNYERVVIVSEGNYESTKNLCEDEERIMLVHNRLNAALVREKGEQEAAVDKNTAVISKNLSGLSSLLEKKAEPLFITVGRFSPEKNHPLLLDAFDMFAEEYPQAGLIIVGGYGAEFESTCAYARELEHWDRVSIVRSLSNPIPLVKAADCFVLSSLYEGLPVTIMEADCVGTPVISTNVGSLQGFMREHGGYLVEGTVEALYKAMCDFKEGKVKTLGIDWDLYDQQATDEFDAIFASRGE